MRPSAETPRSRRRRQTAPPAEVSKDRLETEVASIESGLKLLDVYTAALRDLKERGQDAASDIKLALDVRHAPRDWSNVEILSVMSDIIDEHPRPRLEFVLGVLGVSKVPDSLDERLRSQGAKAYAVGVRTRALRKKKEAREKEERERREKKERQERQRREEQERKERKEREEREKVERERLEKERLEREKVEEEKRRAAQRKESEQKRGRGKGRRGRRGRPPTRVVASERAKKMDTNIEASVAKEKAVATHEEVQKGDTMDVDSRVAKPDDKTRSKKETKAEKKAKETSAQQAEKNRKRDEPLPSNEDTTKASNAGSTGQAGNVATMSAAAKLEQRINAEANADEKERKNAIPTNKAHAKKESPETTKIADASDRQASTAEDASRAVSTGGPKATDRAKEVATAPSGASMKAKSSKSATPRIIEESKIASALKESAAAVNGEVRDMPANAAMAKDIAADVGAGAVDLSGVTKKKEVAVKKAVKENIVSKPKPEKMRDTKDVAIADGKVTRQSETRTTNEPTEQKTKVQTPQTASGKAEEKNEIVKSPAKTEDKGEATRADAGASADEPKEKTPTMAIKPDATGDSEGEKDAKATSKPSDVKIVRDGKKEGTEAADETRTKEAEVEAEDFMADVFGSDEEGEKDDTEEGHEKRGRRYRTRGRQGEGSDSSDDAARAKRESDGEGTKERRKRGRPKGTRRVSRRMSNMRDEIVVAGAGRRMRRESRNLMKRTWDLPEADQYLLECVEVWEGIHANKISIPFREPVTAKDAPGYFDVVKEPMDLKTIKDMLQDGRIGSPVEFYENMRLIVTNALLFNERESDLYELAVELRELIRKNTKPIVKAWKEARGLESDESESEAEMENVGKRGRGRPKKRGRPAKIKKKRKRGREEESGKIKKKRMLRRSSRNVAEEDDDE